MGMETKNSNAHYGQWIIGLMLLAYMATSFDLRHFSFQSPLITVGTTQFRENHLRERIREEKAYGQLMLIRPSTTEGYWLQKVLMNARWDQEVKEKGIEVSEERAKESLREKMCFLDESGKVNSTRLMAFYQKNPTFFQSDMQSQRTAEGLEMGAFTGQGARHSLFRGNPTVLDPEDYFDQSKADTFLRNNGVTLLQMISAEKRALGRRMLQRALANSVFLPDFYKKLAQKGSQQSRSWRSKFFPLDHSNAARISIAEKEVLALVKKAPKWMRHAPEMRTFSVMLTPNFGTLPPKCRKYTVEEFSVLIQDAIGSGKSMQDVVSEKGWSSGQVCSSDRGKALDFSPAVWKRVDGKDLRLPNDVQSAILDRVFAGKEGDIFHIPVAMGGMAWVHIQQVDAPRSLNEKEVYAAAEYHLKKEKSNEMIREKAEQFQHYKTKKDMQSYTMRWGEKPPEGVSAEVALSVFQMMPPPLTSIVKTSTGYHVIELTYVKTHGKEDSDGLSDGTVDVDLEWKKQFLVAYVDRLAEKYPVKLGAKAGKSAFLSGLLGLQSGKDSSESDDAPEGFED